MHQASALEGPAAIAGGNHFAAQEELHNPQPGPGPGQPQAWMQAIKEISDCGPGGIDEQR